MQGKYCLRNQVNDLDTKFRKKWWGCSLLKALQKRQDLSSSVKAGKNLVSQGKAEKKTFQVREYSEQRRTWRKAKNALLQGNREARGQGTDFLVREHREIRLGGWHGTRIQRILNAILRIWTLLWPWSLLNRHTIGWHFTTLVLWWRCVDRLKKEGRGYGQSTTTGMSQQSLYILSWQRWEWREYNDNRKHQRRTNVT